MKLVLVQDDGSHFWARCARCVSWVRAGDSDTGICTADGPLLDQEPPSTYGCPLFKPRDGVEPERALLVQAYATDDKPLNADELRETIRMALGLRTKRREIAAALRRMADDLEGR